jgi:MoxR-like ATPase
VSFADIRSVAPMALRHRLILNFEAEADRVEADALVKQIVDMTATEPMKAAG